MFRTELDTRALLETDNWKLLQPLVWETEDQIIAVPIDFRTDLASIPAPARALIKVNGRHRRAAVLHDYLFVIQDRPLEEVDKIFLEAMKADGVGLILRNTMYAAVRAGSWIPWLKNKKERDRDLDSFLHKHGLKD